MLPMLPIVEYVLIKLGISKNSPMSGTTKSTIDMTTVQKIMRYSLRAIA